MNRLLTVLLLIVTLLTATVSAASAATYDYVHFIPTEITVSNESVCVEGYFVNLNASTYVESFRDFELTVYNDGREVVSGSFGTLNEFTVAPKGVQYQAFTFRGEHDYLKNGTYVADDGYNAVWNGRFSSY